jgi:hypothetical protein
MRRKRLNSLPEGTELRIKDTFWTHTASGVYYKQMVVRHLGPFGALFEYVADRRGTVHTIYTKDLRLVRTGGELTE